jgi:beta-hydroxylase
MNSPTPQSSVVIPPSLLSQPFWDDVLQNIPFCISLKKAFPDILQEMQGFIRTAHPFIDFPKYGNLYSNTWEAFPLSIFEGEFINRAHDPQGLNLKQFEQLVDFARNQLPFTSALLGPMEAQGHLRNAFISRLLPGSNIHPHRGWTAEFLRIHLGLVCDPDCQITLDQVSKTWKAGQLLSFLDGGPFLHSVSHRGKHERIVMSVDLRLSYVLQFMPHI